MKPAHVVLKTRRLLGLLAAATMLALPLSVAYGQQPLPPPAKPPPPPAKSTVPAAPPKAPAAPVIENLRDDHNFTSVWGRMGGQHSPKDVPLPAGVVPPDQVLAKIDDYLQPWAAKKHKEFEALTDAGHLQKTPEDTCMPFTMPGERQETRMGFRFFTTPKLWILIGVDNNFRFIRINGHHPKNLKPTWMGDSIGHWEGQTLVVDTTGFNDKGTIEDGVYHTDKLHMTQRISKSADGKWLVMIYTYDDPGSTTKPFKFARILPFFPGDTMVQQEDECSEGRSSY